LKDLLLYTLNFIVQFKELLIYLLLHEFVKVKTVILDSKSIYMKQLFFVFLVAAILAGCSGKSTSSDNASEASTAVANKTITLAVEGMTCTGCEGTVQETVGKIAGVTSVKASHLDSTAVVSFDSTQTSIATIGDAVSEAGYVFKGEKSPLIQ
jgi:copper chaperone CopZ